MQAEFKVGYSKVVTQDTLIYCDFITSADPTIYELVPDVDKLGETMNASLQEYNVRGRDSNGSPSWPRASGARRESRARRR